MDTALASGLGHMGGGGPPSSGVHSKAPVMSVK